VHDKKAEWIWDVLAELEAAGLVTLADKGYQGATYANPVLGRTSRNPRNKRTAPTRGSAHPASARTPNSGPGRFRANSTAPLGEPGPAHDGHHVLQTCEA
jgi:hypothetical protein